MSSLPISPLDDLPTIRSKIKYRLYGSGPDCLNLKRHDIAAIDNEDTMTYRMRVIRALEKTVHELMDALECQSS